MNRLRCRLWAKITAITLMFLCTGALILSTIGVWILANEGCYIGDGKVLQNDALDSAASHYCSMLYPFVEALVYPEQYDFSQQDFDDLFSKEHCNYFFRVTDNEGNVLLENYQSTAVLRSYTYDWTFTLPSDVPTDTDVYTNTYEGEWIEPAASEELCYTITAGIRSPLTNTDRIYYYYYYASLLLSLRYALLVVVCFLSITIILLLIFLCCSAGRHRTEPTLRLNVADKIPLELYMAIWILLPFLIGWLLYEITYITDIEMIAFVIGAFPCAFSLMMTIATRIKTKTLISNTLCCRLFRTFKKLLKWLWRIVRQIPLFWRTAVIWSIYSLTQAFFFLLCGDEEYLLIWFIEKLILTPLIFWMLIKLQALRKAGKELASGNTGYTVDTAHMPPFLKEHGEHLNHIGEGLQIAVEESTKSERMRVELITNVSHDIKTPLTSIINYVDLLKKEEFPTGKATEYLDVLDRQSYRLKKLTNDLVEASNASTGHITADMSPMDVTITLQQALAEYVDRFASGSLETVLRTERRLDISADGRLLWRVLDNLLGNIAKYSKNDSRVYITAAKEGDNAVIVFKNISAAPLDITPDELTERFVRGDRSRHTDGSGLGLSIAKSLVELQGGTFELVIDGDLFKTILIFPAI